MTRFAYSILVLSGCIPTGPWYGGSSSAPPPLTAPRARSAFDEPEPREPVDTSTSRAAEGRQPIEATTASRTRTVRSEHHLINGRPIAREETAPSSKPVPNEDELDDMVRALKRVAMTDRARRLRTLVDEWYLTVDQVGILIEPIPMGDQQRAISTVACSVIDPEHSSRISRYVTRGQASDAIGTIGQRCFSKFPHDRRPPGKLAAKAAPPPGAYRLPGEE